MSVKHCKDRGHLHHPLSHAAVDGRMSVAMLVESCMESFNGRQLSSACQLYAQELKAGDTLMGMSLTGALVPAGLGRSCLVPLIRAGFVDWMVSTGANLYHDIQLALGFEMFRGSPNADDTVLRDAGVVRIYDLFFEADALYKTDEFIRETIRRRATEGRLGSIISSADLHFVLGEELLLRNPASESHSVLACAAKAGLPIHTSSPGDSGIGMNLAALTFEGINIAVEPSLDVNETAAYVYDAKRNGGKSAVLILGGGSPKNFVLQTEPHIQEVLGLEEAGHDFFMQFTDARPDTGGLSGATPSEAVSWGKIDPEKLNGTVVCYGDCTVYLPLLAHFAMERVGSRPLRRLYHERPRLRRQIGEAYLQNKKS
ncbi:MAG: deoxyhypusine synthase [Candidatus Zixiibacteriota bacterium]